MLAKSCLVTSILALGSSALAVTYTVDNTGAGDYTTIQDAINEADATEVIVVNTGTPYASATALIEKDLILRGDDPLDPPVLSVVGTGSGNGSNDGIFVNGDFDVTIQDLILIPHEAGTDDAIMVNAGGSTQLNLTLQNIHITGNDGSNAPTVPYGADPFVSVDTSAAGTDYFEDCVYIMGTSAFGNGVDGTINCTITDVKVFGNSGGGADAFVIIPGTGATVDVSGLVATHCGRYAVQQATIGASGVGSDTCTFNYTGTRSNPSIIAYQTVVAMYLWEGGTTTIDRAIIADSPTGIRPDLDGLNDLVITNSLFANCADGVLFRFSPIFSGQTADISGSTFFNNENGVAVATSLDASGGGDVVIDVFDSVFAETGATGTAFFHDGTAGTFTASTNLIPSSGSYAIETVAGGASAVTVVSTLDIDPIIQGTNIANATATAFDIQNDDVLGAASDASDLTGWGDKAAAPLSAPSWQSYD